MTVYRELHRWDRPNSGAKPRRDNHQTGRRPPPSNKGKILVPRVEPSPGRLKRCIRCVRTGQVETWWPIELFDRCKKSPDGHASWCKACKARYKRDPAARVVQVVPKAPVAKRAEAERMPPAAQRWRHPAFQKRHTVPVERRGNTFRALITSGVLRVLTREELVQLKGGEVRSCSGKFYRCEELERLESGRDRCGWYGDTLKRREKIPTRCDDCVRLKGK